MSGNSLIIFPSFVVLSIPSTNSLGYDLEICTILFLQFFTKFIILRICFGSISKLLATTSVEVLLASSAISNIVWFEYCLKGTQKLGNTACVEPQLEHFILKTGILMWISKFEILKIIFLWYLDWNGDKCFLLHLGHGVDTKLEWGSNLLSR